MSTGYLVSRGPVDMGRDFAGGETHRWFYDARDLTPLVHPRQERDCRRGLPRMAGGANGLARVPGLLFEADASLPDGTHVVVKSDASWRAVPAATSPIRRSMTPARNQPDGGCRASTMPPGPPAARYDDVGRRWWPARFRR